MHMVIRAIVYAEDGSEALEKAKSIFSRMCGEDMPFDYFVTFDEDGHGISGKDRWGNMLSVARADSEKGKALVAEGMKYQTERFRHALKTVRKQIFCPWKKLSKDSMWRYRCASLYDTPGPNIFLYDNDGSAIGDENHLEHALNKWSQLYKDHEHSPYEGLKVFVVPADVHY